MILSKAERVGAKCEALIVAGKIYGQSFSQKALLADIPKTQQGVCLLHNPLINNISSW